MARLDIEQWEKVTAELEIRRWLAAIGQWTPEVETSRDLVWEKAAPPLGALSQDEIDLVLHQEYIGRIGCHADGKTYVVPIVFAYDGKYIYGHSGEGMKISMMRKNPEVCIEVEHVDSLTQWQSVIAWGRFEELQGEVAEHALSLLIERIKPLAASKSVEMAKGLPEADLEGRTVIYRIALTERTGRFENRN